jgi:hypothetical protein
MVQPSNPHTIAFAKQCSPLFPSTKDAFVTNHWPTLSPPVPMPIQTRSSNTCSVPANEMPHAMQRFRPLHVPKKLSHGAALHDAYAKHSNSAPLPFQTHGCFGDALGFVFLDRDSPQKQPMLTSVQRVNSQYNRLDTRIS